MSAHIVPFQSTLPRGERRVVYIALKVVQNFNPRSREGSDDQLAKTIDDANKISIHAPARGATGLFLHSTWRSGFQSTLPRGERRKSDIVSGAVYAISIHAPARGATGDAVRKQIQATISIHAPARGATKKQGGNRPEYSISIHAPARGATTMGGTSPICSGNFNPRSREGSDAG